jgi:hypothetical protein
MTKSQYKIELSKQDIDRILQLRDDEGLSRIKLCIKPRHAYIRNPLK